MLDLIKAVNPFLGSALFMAVLWLGFRAVTGSFAFWRMAVGVDRRWSTSRFQGLVWFLVVVFSYLALFIARVHVGSTAALGEIPANVLTALGLSLGTTAAAAGITSSRVASGKVVKSAVGGPQQGLAALIEDDQGRPDLTKTQLLVWMIVTLSVFLVAVANGVTQTLATTNLDDLPKLPDIDTTLLVLSGIGQGSYLVTKVSGTSGDKSATGADPGVVASASSAPVPRAGAAAVLAASALPASVRVPNFRPSANGLPFINQFPSEPDLTFELPGIGKIPIGEASNGLCGGMAFTVRDVFETAGLSPVTSAELPKPADPLFKYIVERLIASFDVPGLGFLKYYDWMVTPDGDGGWPPLIERRGIAWKTIVEEWAGRIRPELDAGRLCCLGLVTVATADPGQLGRNHQVLAYGYDLDAARNLRLLIYDPNTPRAGADDVHIDLSLADPERPTTITSNVAIGHPVRGFFRVNYGYRDPTGQLG